MPIVVKRTRAIVPVHYAGVSCEMDSIVAIARRHNLKVVEDAAQGVMASYKGRALGDVLMQLNGWALEWITLTNGTTSH